MTSTSDFPLVVVANACAGAAALRSRLNASGLDTTTIARLLKTSPLTIARATKTGATPRGVLIGLAALTAVTDRLAARGIGVADVATADDEVAAVLTDLAAESPVAERMIARLRALTDLRPGPVQLSLDAQVRAAA